MLFVPLDPHLHIDARHSCVHRDVLNKRGILEVLLDSNHGAERPALDQLHFVGFVEVPVLLLEICIDVPGVPALGLVIEGLKQVSADERLWASGIGVGQRKRFGLASQIDQTGDASGLWIDFQLDVFVS